MYSGFGTDVPYMVGDVQSVAHPVADGSGVCGSAIGVQQMLTDLGYYAGRIGGSFTNELYAAIKKMAAAEGVAYSGGLPKPVCQALIDAWTRFKFPPQTSPVVSGSVKVFTPSYTLSAISKPALIGQMLSTSVPRSGEAGVTDKITNWWGGLSTGAKFGVAGGGVLAVGALVYAFSGGKSQTATANRRRARRRSRRASSNAKAPAGPSSGFGKEKTPGDIRARISWEKWAAATARKQGHEAVATGHDLARVAYEDLLRKRGAKPNRKAAGAWNVYLSGKHIDTVFYHGDMTADEVRRSLISHDGYSSGITVRRRS